jgi:hypothetical protein
MRARLDVAVHALFGACAVPGECLAVAATLLLGAVCLAGAFVVPCLFGPVAAAVIATERLLCAARTSSTNAALVWAGVACGWIAAAAYMLHTPWVSLAWLQWVVVLLIASSAVCRLWATLEASSSESAPAAIWVIGSGVVVQAVMLFHATSAPFSRVAAAVAIELVLIGVLRLLQAARSRRDAHDSARLAAAHASARAAFSAGMSRLQTRIA